MANDFRKAVYPSGSKSDPVDADLLLDLLLTHRDRLRLWRPDTEQTRELQFLVEDRRRMVDEKDAGTEPLDAAFKDVLSAGPVLVRRGGFGVGLEIP